MRKLHPRCPYPTVHLVRHSGIRFQNSLRSQRTTLGPIGRTGKKRRQAMHRRFRFAHWLSSILLVQALVGIPAAMGEEKLTSSSGNDAAVDEGQADEAIRRALNKKVSVDFNAVPLSQV